MSSITARALKVTALAVTLAIFAANSQKSQAQFPKRFTPQNPLLNNGSLYTFPNPTNGLPSQLPYAYVAVAHQDCRLYHNGATLMPVNRLLAGQCTDMMPAVVQLSAGFIPQYQQSIFFQSGGQQGGQQGNNLGNNQGNNNGNLFGNLFGNNGGIFPPQMAEAQAMRYQQQAYMRQAYMQQAYMQQMQYQAMRNAAMQSNAYDNYRTFAGNAVPVAGQAAPAPYFNAVPNTAVGFGMQAVGANPFAAFNVDREDKNKNKDKNQDNPARKEEDALPPEGRKNDD